MNAQNRNSNNARNQKACLTSGEQHMNWFVGVPQLSTFFEKDKFKFEGTLDSILFLVTFSSFNDLSQNTVRIQSLRLLQYISMLDFRITTIISLVKSPYLIVVFKRRSSGQYCTAACGRLGKHCAAFYRLSLCSTKRYI